MKRLLKFALSFIVIVSLLLGLSVYYIDSYFTPPVKGKPITAPGKGYIEGTICEPTGMIPFTLPGIPEAEITAEPGGASVKADEKGNYTLNNLNPGLYTLTIKSPGYEETSIEKVMVFADSGTLIQKALFPEPKGKPEAHIEVTSPIPFKKPPENFSYNQNVQISSAKSRNVSYKGFRWEIRDEKGEVIIDQYKEPKEPLQLEPSPAFGASPYTFIFNPPSAGLFTIKLFLTNPQFPDTPDTSELTIKAVNIKPEALTSVIAGPEPIRKSPAGNMRESSGLTIVPVGSKVFLKGFANDKNFFSPELYNSGGTSPDIYGKNHDHFQRQYGWQWKLEYREIKRDGTPAQAKDITDKLVDINGSSGKEVQYPNFTASDPGKYIATLVVNDNDPYGALESEPSSISITTAEDTSENSERCAGCHSETVTTFSLSHHGSAGTGCIPCHGPAILHLTAETENKKNTIGVSYEAGLCGQCHEQYNEWEKSRHSDAESYGYYEIAKPLMVNCYKCHYSRFFAESIEKISEERISFHELQYKKRFMSIGPLMPDLSKVPGEKDARITCQSCHDSHPEPNKTPYSLRISEEENICGTCHYEKWQNAVLEGFSGKIKNGYEYPEQDYNALNPHNTTKKCIFCHMNRGIDTDVKGVRAVGGHTLRMRDAGADNILGGFGPSNQDPLIERDRAANDDILNMAPCQECHPGLDTFNRNGFQQNVYEKWIRLGELLKARNKDRLPDFKPGDKCSTCHRGGTLPFDNDPELILENAYTNYKLVKNDRSWGIHNPKYVIKLLDDSINSVEKNYPVKQ